VWEVTGFSSFTYVGSCTREKSPAYEVCTYKKRGMFSDAGLPGGSGDIDDDIKEDGAKGDDGAVENYDEFDDNKISDVH
jgi:hypothetical protein